MARTTRAENTARTREIRLRKAGVNNQAATRYRQSLKEIRESGLPTAEKQKLREAASQAFIESGQSTLTEIKKSFKEAVDQAPAGSMETIAANTSLSTAEKSRFLDASENQKISILASHYLSSEQIRAVMDAANYVYGDSPEDAAAAFYSGLSNMIETAYNNPGMDQAALNNLIIDIYGDEYD